MNDKPDPTTRQQIEEILLAMQQVRFVSMPNKMTVQELPINISEATIAKLDVRPGDVVVLSCEKVVTTELAHHIRQFFAHYMPEVKVVVLDRGLKLAVLSRQPEADQPIEVKAQ